MPKKKKTGKKDKKPAKDAKKKGPIRPTRCPPDFKWAPKPKLVEAAVTNDVWRVKRLLNRGADPNEALHQAVGRGKLGVVDELLAAGVDLHTEIMPGDYFEPPPPPADAPKEKKAAKKGSKGKKKKAKKKG